MEGKRAGLSPVVLGVGILTVVSSLAAVGLGLFGRPVAAAVVGTATAFFWLGLLVVSTMAVTAWWTRQTMVMGADLVLRSQENDGREKVALSNEKVALINATSDLTRAMLRQPSTSAELPMLEAGGEGWLPELSEFVEGEVVENTDRSDGRMGR